MVPVDKSRRSFPSLPVSACPFSSRKELAWAGLNASCLACLVSTLPVISLNRAESAVGLPGSVGVAETAGGMADAINVDKVSGVAEGIGVVCGEQALSITPNARNIEIKTILGLFFILPPKLQSMIMPIILAQVPA
jgi:hypothetical protein